MSDNTKKLTKLAVEAQRLKLAMKLELEKVSLRIDALNQERKTLSEAPLNKADLRDALAHDIAQRAAEAAPEVLYLIQDARTRCGTRVTDPDDNANYSPVPAKPSRELLALLLGPDLILSALAPLIDKIDFKDSGLPINERRGRIAEIDKELTALRSEQTDLKTALN